MAMMADEIRDLSTEEILSQLEDAREELMKMRFQTATGELTDPNQLRITRRFVARLLTILKEREGEENEESDEEGEG